MTDVAEIEAIASLVEEIVGLRPQILASKTSLEATATTIRQDDFPSAVAYHQRALCVRVFSDALGKCQILVETNLRVIETLGVLALTRYLFELLVQLKELDADPRQAIELFVQISEGQESHLLDHEKKLRSEAAFFRELQEQDFPWTALELFAAPDLNSEAIAEQMEQAERAVDLKARRRFSLYGAEARFFGYGPMAHKIETEILPAVTARRVELRQSLADFVQKIGQAELDGITRNSRGNRKRSTWKERSTRVGMLEQYEFIYSFTSRLLHATPVSFVTRQQTLHGQEFRTFLDFCYVALLDILDLAGRQAG